MDYMNYPKIIYAIQHRITKKIYIGSTNCLEKRYQAHLSLLRNNKHNSPVMQKEYNEFGGFYDVFILDEIESCEQNFKEYEWMRYYNTQNPLFGYNAKDKGRMEKESRLPLKSGKPERLPN